SEYVFDFELEDEELSEEDPDDPIKADIEPRKSLMRQSNMVEANLSRTFAADAPSHRGAWRKIQQGSTMYDAVRRAPSSNDGS
nr:hypothetical protein [Tanacetum cinerariifolium]